MLMIKMMDTMEIVFLYLFVMEVITMTILLLLLLLVVVVVVDDDGDDCSDDDNCCDGDYCSNLEHDSCC